MACKATGEVGFGKRSAPMMNGNLGCDEWRKQIPVGEVGKLGFRSRRNCLIIGQKLC